MRARRSCRARARRRAGEHAGGQPARDEEPVVAEERCRSRRRRRARGPRARRRCRRTRPPRSRPASSATRPGRRSAPASAARSRSCRSSSPRAASRARPGRDVEAVPVEMPAGVLGRVELHLAPSRLTPAATWKRYSMRCGFQDARRRRLAVKGAYQRVHAVEPRRARGARGRPPRSAPALRVVGRTAARVARARAGEQRELGAADRIEAVVGAAARAGSDRAARRAGRGRAARVPSGRRSWSPASAASRTAAGPVRTASRSTAVSSGSPSAPRSTTGPTAVRRARPNARDRRVARRRPRRAAGSAASSPVNSPICHWRPNIQSGSAMRASGPSSRAASTVVGLEPLPGHVAPPGRDRAGR